MQLYPKSKEPFEWADLQSNLGVALEISISFNPNSSNKSNILKESIEAIKNALTVYTKNEDTEYWILLNSNLGVTLVDLGK